MCGAYCYEYPRPAVTVDLVVFTLREGKLHVLLIERRHDPFRGRWAIPGGFLEMDEAPDAGARRELREETGIEVPWPVAPVGFFAEPGRDPRGRTVSLAYATVCRTPGPDPTGSDDAAGAAWVPVEQARDLAFDHDQILERALNWLAGSLAEGSVGWAMLPDRFTAKEAAALWAGLQPRNDPPEPWHRPLVRAGRLERLGGRPARYHWRPDGHRPAAGLRGKPTKPGPPPPRSKRRRT